MVNTFKWLLLPLSIAYAAVLKVRHFLYDRKILKSKSFSIPVICVGNVSVGGTGKTPMVDYLIGLLKEKYRLGVVSRGYKRKTKGFTLASPLSTAKEIGDEPCMYLRKHREIEVAVDEKRARAVENLLIYRHKTQVVILDDAMQHRGIKPSFTVVMTSYERLFTDDFLLPVGRLRDFKSRVKTGDCLIVSKCPDSLTREKAEQIKEKVGQKMVYFTAIRYGKNCVGIQKKIELEDYLKERFTLVTGVANPNPLKQYLREKGGRFTHIDYGDHHNFTVEELKKLSKEKRILTTEKDFSKLGMYLENVLYLPIETYFLFGEKQKFDSYITKHIEEKMAKR